MEYCQKRKKKNQLTLVKVEKQSNKQTKKKKNTNPIMSLKVSSLWMIDSNKYLDGLR